MSGRREVDLGLEESLLCGVRIAHCWLLLVREGKRREEERGVILNVCLVERGDRSRGLKILLGYTRFPFANIQICQTGKIWLPQSLQVRYKKLAVASELRYLKLAEPVTQQKRYIPKPVY